MAFKIQNNRSRKREPMSEINVTPFVDVMLVLLPDSSANSLPDDKEPLTLSINAKGETFIQETQVETSQLVPKILAMSKNRTDTRIYVRGDKAIDYGRVMEVMGLLSRAGFTKVALISGPPLSKSKK